MLAIVGCAESDDQVLEGADEAVRSGGCKPEFETCLVVAERLHATKWTAQSFEFGRCSWSVADRGDGRPGGDYNCKLSKRRMMSFDRATRLSAHNVRGPNTSAYAFHMGRDYYWPSLDTDRSARQAWLADGQHAQATMFLRSVSRNTLVFDVVLGSVGPQGFSVYPYLEDDFALEGYNGASYERGHVSLSMLATATAVKTATRTTTQVGGRFVLGPIVAVGLTAISLLDGEEDIEVPEDHIELERPKPVDVPVPVPEDDKECRGHRVEYIATTPCANVYVERTQGWASYYDDDCNGLGTVHLSPQSEVEAETGLRNLGEDPVMANVRKPDIYRGRQCGFLRVILDHGTSEVFPWQSYFYAYWAAGDPSNSVNYASFDSCYQAGGDARVCAESTPTGTVLTREVNRRFAFMDFGAFLGSVDEVVWAMFVR